ncbi:hypothetical protein FB45DRAFT_1053535 [Roridomyces roridus]|uniref:Uncharacterized protein n=1 Tax=Roridomyces roridus TaxID=1738132 RepID=A0AAD7FZ42_9AGAR|nr:hypothetical protein FB45DRAFT_1053535 [Roridomyces roridus]
MSAAASTVAQIPELSGHIVDFLETSPPDLTADKTLFSQSLLFRDIHLDEAPTGSSAMKLARMLESISSPQQFELISLIRCVQMPIHRDTLMALAEANITLFAVRDLIFTGVKGTCPIKLAQHLVAGMPALRKLTLANALRDFVDLVDLLCCLPPTIESLAFRFLFLHRPTPSGIFEGTQLRIKSLDLFYASPVEDWLLSPSSPCDLSQMEAFGAIQWTDSISKIFHTSQTIMRLKMPGALIFDHVDAPHLARLTSLEISSSSNWHFEYVTRVIAKIPAENVLQFLTLEIPEEAIPVSGFVELDQAIDQV